MHATWKDNDERAFVHQARIAGAINILLLKLMGYSGKVKIRRKRPISRRGNPSASRR
jgi:hypothetical protein